MSIYTEVDSAAARWALDNSTHPALTAPLVAAVATYQAAVTDARGVIGAAGEASAALADAKRDHAENVAALEAAYVSAYVAAEAAVVTAREAAEAFDAVAAAEAGAVYTAIAEPLATAADALITARADYTVAVADLGLALEAGRWSVEPGAAGSMAWHDVRRFVLPVDADDLARVADLPADLAAAVEAIATGAGASPDALERAALVLYPA